MPQDIFAFPDVLMEPLGHTKSLVPVLSEHGNRVKTAALLSSSGFMQLVIIQSNGLCRLKLAVKLRASRAERVKGMCRSLWSFWVRRSCGRVFLRRLGVAGKRSAAAMLKHSDAAPSASRQGFCCLLFFFVFHL